MEAKLIPGKKGRSKRDRIEALDTVTRAGGWGYDMTASVFKSQVLAILDTDEPDGPDQVQVTMSREQAEVFAQYWNNPFSEEPFHDFTESLRQALKE